jgi:hypothetical protein
LNELIRQSVDMPLPLPPVRMGAAACDEVTRINCDGQFKPLFTLTADRGDRLSETKMWIWDFCLQYRRRESFAGQTSAFYNCVME